MAQQQPILSDEMLRGFAGRAAGYDRENRFFQEDFEDLERAGYLTMACRGTRRTGPDAGRGLPRAAPAGLPRAGDGARHQHARLLGRRRGRPVARGRHARSNGCCARRWRARCSPPATPSAATTFRCCCRPAKAERVEGGFRFTGHKMFGSLAPVWTRYGLHAMWADAEGGPKIVHAFLPRDTPGLPHRRDLGHAGHARDAQRRRGARRRVRSRQVRRADRAGRRRRCLRRSGVFAWALTGLRQRLLRRWRGARSTSRLPAMQGEDVDRGQPHPWPTTRKSSTRSPQMALALDPIGPHLEKVARGLDDGVDHGATWPAKIVSAKHHAVEACWQHRRPGDGGLRRRRHVPDGNELERLFRDARCGRFHPANAILVHEIVGKTALGIDLGEQPRWG